MRFDVILQPSEYLCNINPFINISYCKWTKQSQTSFLKRVGILWTKIFFPPQFTCQSMFIFLNFDNFSIKHASLTERKRQPFWLTFLTHNCRVIFSWSSLQKVISFHQKLCWHLNCTATSEQHCFSHNFYQHQMSHCLDNHLWTITLWKFKSTTGTSIKLPLVNF